MDCPAAPETGGRGEGKGAGSAPRTAAPTTLQTGLQFLTKDFLTFRMVNIRREGHGETQGARTNGGADRDWGWGRGGEKAHCTRGECARQAPGCRSCSDGKGTKSRCSFLFRAFVEHPRAGTARSTRHAPSRAARSLSSIDGESSTSPSLQCEETSNRNKRPPPPSCVRAEIRH